MQNVYSNADLTRLQKIARMQGASIGLWDHESDDLAQVVLIELMTTGVPVRQPRAWVRQVARRKAWQMLIKRTPLAPELPPDRAASPQVAERIDLSRALGRLSEEELDVWFARRVLKQTISEVADDGEMSASTVKRRLATATARVQRAMSI